MKKTKQKPSINPKRHKKGKQIIKHTIGSAYRELIGKNKGGK